MGEMPAQVKAETALNKGQIEPASVIGVDSVCSFEQTKHFVGSDVLTEKLPELMTRTLHECHADHRQVRTTATESRCLDV